MAASERRALLKGWRKAVQRSLGWVGDDDENEENDDASASGGKAGAAAPAAAPAAASGGSSGSPKYFDDEDNGPSGGGAKYFDDDKEEARLGPGEAGFRRQKMRRAVRKVTVRYAWCEGGWRLFFLEERGRSATQS